MLYLSGFCLELGFGVERNLAAAVAAYWQAAQFGSRQARYRLSLCFRDGVVLPRDRFVAMLCLKVAAEGGVPDAQFDYAVCLECGILCIRDHPLACAFFERAAVAGNGNARIVILAMESDFPHIPWDSCRQWASTVIREEHSSLTYDRTLDPMQARVLRFQGYPTGWTDLCRSRVTF
jgi:hypothetical protein